MRVAIIIPRIGQLGPVKVIQALVNTLYKREDIQIMVFYMDKNVDPCVKMMVPVERLNSDKFLFNDYDIIHTNGIRPDLFAFINRKKIKYHISTIHNFVFVDLEFTYNWLISLIFGHIWLYLWKRADKLVCVSKAMKSYYGKWFSSGMLEVIHNGIADEDDTYAPDNDVISNIEGFHSKGLKVIGCIGVLTRRKGIDQVLNLIASNKVYSLIIIGIGKELSKLKNQAKRLEIADRCVFCGFRSSAVNYFKHFDLIIVPSRSEGFGLALIEAIQQKVPMICSDIEVFKELFNTEEVTFFKSEDLDSLSESLKFASEEGEMKAELAYKRYLTNYTAAIMAINYYNLYKSVSLNTVIS